MAVSPSGGDWLTTDGWSYTVFGATLHRSLAAAQAGWERSRTATWLVWHEEAFPVGWEDAPVTAEGLDGITIDPESVAEFRRRRPDAAAEIVGPLDRYVEGLEEAHRTGQICR